mmetsp:Transcript_12596/g.28523  ORF Transcript_12596/g.28523 Transcript_12596/m.28523 type:complete len:1041 (-) Transcript_12596:143-3265(-)
MQVLIWILCACSFELTLSKDVEAGEVCASAATLPSHGRTSLIAQAVGVTKEAVRIEVLDVDKQERLNASVAQHMSESMHGSGSLLPSSIHLLNAWMGELRTDQAPGERPLRRPWDQEATTPLSCGELSFAPSASRCPQECPFRKPDFVTGCNWMCVAEEECSGADPRDEKFFADAALQECRHCEVAGCRVCEAGMDACAECMEDFDIGSGGVCVQKPMLVRRIFVSLLCLAGVATFIVYLMFLCAEHINMFNLHKAETHREHSKMRSLEGNHVYWDILTDLRKMPADGSPPVGGPGLLLLFNYQFSILVWVLVVIIGWLWVCFFVSPEMLLLGTTLAEDDVEVCQAVRWGSDTRERLRVAKATFVGGLYVLSLSLTLLFSRMQKNRQEDVDNAIATMGDYAIEINGLPKECGERVELDIARFVRDETGMEVVGVSVAWDYSDCVGEIVAQATAELRKREMHLEKDRGDLWEEHCDDELSQVRRRHINTRVWVYYTYCLLIKKVFEVGMGRRQVGPVRQSERTGRSRRSTVLASQDREDLRKQMQKSQGLQWFSDTTGLMTDRSDQEIEELLQSVQSSGTAYVVFETEHDRDKALALLSLSRKYKGEEIGVQLPGCDPENIAWENYGLDKWNLTMRMGIGVLVMIGAMVLWTIVFYMPYAHLEIAAYSTHGRAPHYIYELVFSLVVCVGNLALYLICSLVAENAGFRSREEASGAYLILYTTSVFCNIAVDISISAATAYWWLRANDVRNDDGVMIADMATWADIFMSYPMQKALARMLFYYNFPTSFLFPYIAESIGIIAVPYHLGYRVVISYKMPRQLSENLLEPMPMDLSRYGDILVSVTLAVLSLFLSSGLVLWNFLGLLIGNAYIFCYDHYRVLRHVGQFYFSCGWVDTLCRRMLSIPVGLMASCCTFQLYGMGYGTRYNLWLMLSGTFFAHIVLHMVLYRIVVDGAQKQQSPAKKNPSDITYGEAAKQYPGNWFTENPVHCLRSQFIHKHDPPCMFYVKGKEHSMPKNEKIGNWYSCPPPHLWATDKQPHHHPAG